MSSAFGTGPVVGLWVILLADAAVALLAAMGLLDLPPARAAAASLPDLLAVPAVALAFVGANALGGFYRPQAWSRPRLLAGCAASTLALLLFGTLVVAVAAGPLAPRPHHELWVVPICYVAAMTALRWGLAMARQGAGAANGLAPLGAALPAAAPRGAHAASLHAVTVMPGGGGSRGLGRGGVSRLADEFDAAPSARRGGFAVAGADAAGLRPYRDASHGRIDLDTLPAGWLAEAAVAREGRAARVLRRGFDILGSIALLLAVLPVLLLTALAIRLESRGPVFYRQERVGKDGRVFTLFKFRSMAVDAEQGGPRWALPRDPRVTRVGRIIRLTRIDEIPQVINVLRGEMALIGPRPERPAFVEQLAAVIPHYRSRHAVRPGITGWAQVNYPYGASVDDARNKLAYDLFYIQRRSMALDLSIIAGTIRVVVLQEGAR
jgi:lipopolysaccharide/colanic/teichoic acid biosynthesis glycosyltransferase